MKVDSTYLASAIRCKAKAISSLRGNEDVSDHLAAGHIQPVGAPCPLCGQLNVLCCYADVSLGDSHHYYDNWCHVCLTSTCSYGSHTEHRTQVGQETANDGVCPWCARNVFASPPLTHEDLFLQLNMPTLEVINFHDELKRYLARHPDRLRSLDARRFEELIADILRDFGFETELTGITRDNGRDIYAYVRNQITSFLMFVECKQWTTKKVGIEVVQRVYGSAKAGGAHKSMVVTTSFFTRPAMRHRDLVASELELKDYNDLKVWLSRYE